VSFLQAGCGFGGSCLPKDVKALVAHGEGAGTAMTLLRSVLAVNEAQPSQIVRMLQAHFPTLSGLRVGVLGLAFKPDTDDIRESPAIPVIELLRARNMRVKAYDPVAMPQARKILGTGIAFATNLEECIEDVDAVVLLTRWKQFDAVPALLARLKSPPLLVDGRRQLGKASVARYTGIGV
jgi:UDPglucose 6-dehydrogenase/GDP-mannose 6-dehydrogenase